MGQVIQIVEDDQDISYIIEYIISDLGLKSETFGCINDFLNRKGKEEVNLFIIDVRLPDGNGIELSRSLKDSDPTCNIPIIIMSAHAAKKDAMLNGKAEDFIAKPFDIQVLIDKINHALYC
jgi:FixJ family two-component response regulator